MGGAEGGGGWVLALMYLGLYLLKPSGAVCPAGWDDTESGCFKVVTDKQSWPDAQAQCESEGLTATGIAGSLAVPSTLKRDTDLNTLVQSKYDSSTNDNQRQLLRSLWIAGYEEFGITKWRVLDGMRPAFVQGCFGDQTQARDLPHQAASLSEQGMNVSLCVNYCRKENYLYAGLQRGFECHCGNSYGSYGTTTGCTTRCTGDPTAYCGGVSKNSVYNVQANAAFTNWAFNQPNNFDNFQACGALEQRNQWKMGDEGCFNDHYFICHVAASPCPGTSRYQLLNGKCLYYGVDTRTSWFEARHDCKNMNGELVTIDSEAERVAIGAKLDTYNRKSDTGVFAWIGLFGKQWMWKNNEPVIYTNWDDDEPNEFTKNCMKFNYEEIATRRGYLWQDETCVKQLGFICQLEVELTTAAPTTTTTLTTTNTLTSSTTGAPYTTTTTTTTTPVPATTKPATNAPGVTDPGSKATTTATNGNTNGTVTTPGGTPDAGASTGGAGGFTLTELVLLGVLGFIVLLVIILVICCFCHYKKNKESRASVYPEKSADARNQVLVPYGDYYGNQYPSDNYNNDTYNASYTNDTYKNTFYDNESKSGGLVLNADKLYKEETNDYMNYKPAATLKVMGSNVNDDGLPALRSEKTKKKKKRGSRYAENEYEELPTPRQMPRIVLD